MRHPLLASLLLATGLVLCPGPPVADPSTPVADELEQLHSAAEAGDPEAQYRLGLRYLHGQGTPVDEAWAITWLRRAAAAGREDAAMELARLYERNGISPIEAAALTPPGELDPATRLRLMAAALDAGHRGDRKTALRLLRRLAEAGETEARYRLALLLLEGPEESRPEALKWLQAAAAEGHAEAAEALQREGPPKEPTQAQPGLFSRLVAILRGEPRPDRQESGKDAPADATAPAPAPSPAPASGGLAGTTRDETPPAASVTAPPPGQPRSDEERLMEQAERELEQGNGAKAARIYETLARTGSAEAQYRLGRMYRNGEGITADAAWAVTWLRRAARRGHPRAREELAAIYRESGLEAPRPATPYPATGEAQGLPPVIRLRHREDPGGGATGRDRRP